MHIVPCGSFLSSLDRSLCSVCGWLEDRCAGGQGRHDLHCMRGWEVLRSIDTSMHELCSRTVCGVGGIERIERLHWVLGGEVRGRDGVGVGVGMHSMRRWLSDGHAGVGGRHEVHGLRYRSTLRRLDCRLRGMCSWLLQRGDVCLLQSVHCWVHCNWHPGYGRGFCGSQMLFVC